MSGTEVSGLDRLKALGSALSDGVAEAGRNVREFGENLILTGREGSQQGRMATVNTVEGQALGQKAPALAPITFRVRRLPVPAADNSPAALAEV